MELIPLDEFSKFKIKLEVTPNQLSFIKSIRKNPVTICHGMAGTGKSYIAIAEAIRTVLSGANKDKAISKALFLRPAVTVEENLGFLPGTLEEKTEPYMAPYEINLGKLLNHGNKFNKNFSYQTLSYLRGVTFDNVFVIMDEAQNASIKQLRMLLTRMGRHCKIVIIGDDSQADIGNGHGLKKCINALRHVRGIGVCKLDYEDNMRHPIIKDIIMAFDGISEEESQEKLEDVLCSMPGVEPIEYGKDF